MKTLLSVALTIALAPAAALACEGEEKAWLKTVTTVEGAQLVKEKAAIFVDVNGVETREKNGIIPGAVLLSSYDYAAGELPSAKDSKLVFYCASQQCGASKKAAHKALTEGYVNVWVLPEGIKGWKAAGNPTVTAASKKS